MSKVPAYKKRVKCNSFRLPAWLVAWLLSQEESGGKLIENALLKTYEIEVPK